MKRWILLAALIAAPLVAGAQMKGMDMKDQVHKGTGVVTNVDLADDDHGVRGQG